MPNCSELGLEAVFLVVLASQGLPVGTASSDVLRERGAQSDVKSDQLVVNTLVCHIELEILIAAGAEVRSLCACQAVDVACSALSTEFLVDLDHVESFSTHEAELS